MLIRKRKTDGNLGPVFLSEVGAYFHKQSHTVLHRLNTIRVPAVLGLTRNGSSPTRDVVRPEDAQTLQRQQQIQITVRQIEGQAPVTLLHLGGALDADSFLDVIAAAQEAYAAGTRNIILDMRDVPSLGLSSVLALHSIAVLLRGEQPLDPTMAWQSLRPIVIRDLTSNGLQKRFKLLSAQPQVAETLEQWGLTAFVEVHTDLKVAVASF